MEYRTDLAIENNELLEEAKAQVSGFIKKEKQYDEDICVTEIKITSAEGEKAFGKKKGSYITVEVKGILEQKDGIKGRTSQALALELKKLIPFDYYLKVLVIGLGNEKVTPDSLGPHTVDKVKITSHLFEMFEADGDWDMANVSGFNPSVTGVTGLETADVIEKVASIAEPDAVIIIDSLAARNLERLSTTIQLSDTGIEPGAGMGNRRKAINQELLGCKVVAVGVPTVIDSKTLIMEAFEELKSSGSKDGIEGKEGIGKKDGKWHRYSQEGEKEGWQPCNPADDEAPEELWLRDYFESRSFDMIVTSTDIDELIKDFSDIISNAINITLHPGIYS